MKDFDFIVIPQDPLSTVAAQKPIPERNLTVLYPFSFMPILRNMYTKLKLLGIPTYQFCLQLELCITI